jgi:hypothetical protein
LQLGGIFLIWLRDPSIIIRSAGEEFGGERKTFDADDFTVDSVNNSRKVKRVSIVI